MSTDSTNTRKLTEIWKERKIPGKLVSQVTTTLRVTVYAAGKIRYGESLSTVYINITFEEIIRGIV